jgi:hypothetical protein
MIRSLSTPSVSKQFKFFLKNSFRKGPYFAYSYLKARSSLVYRWRNPFAQLSPQAVPLHILVGDEQFKMSLWMLISFFQATRKNWKVYLYDDGTLKSDAKDRLRRLGILAEVIDKKLALTQAERHLAEFPICMQVFRNNILATKFFGPLMFDDSQKYLVLDSDLLFFREPLEILNWAHSDADELYFNKDVKDWSQVDQATCLERLGFELWPKVNSGLCCISRSAIDLHDTERFLSDNGLYQKSDPWMLEQTLFALHASKNNLGGLLPDTYEISLGADSSAHCIARHYVGKVRDRFYTEGCKRVQREVSL